MTNYWAFKNRKTPKLDLEAIKKRCQRAYFRDLRDTHLLIHGKPEYIEACVKWLFGDINP